MEALLTCAVCVGTIRVRVKDLRVIIDHDMSGALIKYQCPKCGIRCQTRRDIERLTSLVTSEADVSYMFD